MVSGLELMVSGVELMVSGGKVKVSGAFSDGIRRLMVSGAKVLFRQPKHIFVMLSAKMLP